MPDVAGFDISPTQGAGVLLDPHGILLDWFWYSDKSAAFNKHRPKKCKDTPWVTPDGRGTRHPRIEKGDDYEERQLVRLAPCAKTFMAWTKRLSSGSSACLEGYATRAPSGAHHIGEIGGIFRLTISLARIPLRVMDPTSIKFFTTGRGDAEKPDIKAAIDLLWPQSIRTEWMDLPKDVCEGLYDSVALAQFLALELRVRDGDVDLPQLEARERHVFLRVTKNNPVNVLARDFFVRR